MMNPHIKGIKHCLWDKVGVEFWKSFFFELPFVICRTGIWVIFLVTGIMYGYWALKAKKEYAKIIHLH